jgi:hypothetical protein
MQHVSPNNKLFAKRVSGSISILNKLMIFAVDVYYVILYLNSRKIVLGGENELDKRGLT